MLELPVHRYRYRLALELYRTLTLAGLALAGWGLMNLIPLAGIATGAAMFDAGSLSLTGRSASGFDWPFVLAILARCIFTTGGGVILAATAYRAFRNRRRAGPPPNSNGLEKSPIRRAIATVIYGVAASVSGATLLAATDMTIRDIMLTYWGKSAVGRIYDVRPAPEIDDDVEQLTYSFRTADGIVMDGIKNQWTFKTDRPGMNDMVEVTYLETSPMTNVAGFSFTLGDLFGMIGMQFIVFCVGVWGFATNSGLAAAPPEAPASGTAPTRSISRSAQTHFGRRT
jgi:hypothetical protein